MMDALEIIFSFAVTWAVILTPPIAVRALRRTPIERSTAILTCVVLYFVNFVIFAALGSTSTSHMAVLIGALISYRVLSWQTKTSAARMAAARRKALGYSD